MENAQAYQPKPIKSGKYEFYIKGVVTEDNNGYTLKIKNGNNIGQAYRKLKLLLIDGEDSHTVDKLIFSKKDIKEIVLAINNSALTHIFNQKSDNFEDENLIGEGGWLIMGKRFNEADGKSYPRIECFIKARSEPQVEVKQNTLLNAPVSNETKHDSEDDAPF